jgi:hypothetical protein
VRAAIFTRRTVIAVAVTVVILAMGTTSADADLVGQRDWQLATNDVLGQSYVNTGNVVGFWQAFIATYGQLPCQGGIDGHFGPATAQGTRNVQSFLGLAGDGIVGPNTWHTASDWLFKAGGDGFLTTYWEPNYGDNPFATYTYVYGGPWYWESFGTGPFEQHFPTNHPDISFQSVSWC